MRALPALALVLALGTLASACTWVPMAEGAASVKVLGAGAAPAGCTRRGEVEVSVADSVAFYERNELRVREELETLARNEALGLKADAVQPLDTPRNGRQRFAAWACGAAR